MQPAVERRERAGSDETKRRPLIGITTVFGQVEESLSDHSPHAYAAGVYRAGGLPLLLPNLTDGATPEQLTTHLDGLLLTGGVDVGPHYFGEEPMPCLGEISPERDRLEIPLTRAALAAELPILAICRGFQLLNVVAGGTLYQDIGAQIPNALQHRQRAPRWYASHTVTIEAECRTATMLGSGPLRVNSLHHQALCRVADEFRITARAPDGVIEAIESVRHDFVLGVQWHPEAMWEREPLFLTLFQALVDEALRGRGGRRCR